MMKRPSITIFPLLFLLLAVIGCAHNKGGGTLSDGSTTVTIIGTIRFLDLEGGVYVIESDDGARYKPVNLGTEFQKDSLEVEAEVIEKGNVASNDMVGSIVEIVSIHKRFGDGSATLLGTKWRVKEINDKDVLKDVEVTLEFIEEGSFGGKGSCNSFSGQVTITGARLKFSQIVSTKMACSSKINDQERRYFTALERAYSYEIKGDYLTIYSESKGELLELNRARD